MLELKKQAVQCPVPNIQNSILFLILSQPRVASLEFCLFLIKDEVQILSDMVITVLQCKSQATAAVINSQTNTFIPLLQAADS